MPRRRTIHLGALNIVIHPHSPEMYLRLFEAAREIKQPVRYWADHMALLGEPRSIEKDPLNGVYGYLYRYIEIDSEEPWMNTAAEKPADEKDLEGLSIPEHLKPGLTMTRYVFFPKKHRLFFEAKNAEGKTMSPRIAQKIFSLTFNREQIIETFGEVTVIAEPSKEGLDKIFSIPMLRTLSMEINRPNSDDLHEAEKKVMERLGRQNAQKEHVTLSSEKGRSLAPDDETKVLAEIAASNGKVIGQGKDLEGNPLEESTVEHPWKGVASFDPKTQEELAALVQKAKEYLNTFDERRRR